MNLLKGLKGCWQPWFPDEDGWKREKLDVKVIKSHQKVSEKRNPQYVYSEIYMENGENCIGIPHRLLWLNDIKHLFN